MTRHELKQCLGWSVDNECMKGSIELCQSQSASLGESPYTYVAVLYDDCYCVAYLVALLSKYDVGTFRRRISDNLSGRQ